jgi:hypothetical protein
MSGARKRTSETQRNWRGSTILGLIHPCQVNVTMPVTVTMPLGRLIGQRSVMRGSYERMQG